MKAIAALLLCPLLVGCAGLDHKKSSEPVSKITVYREPDPSDSIFAMFFGVDGRPIAGLQPNQEVSFELASGAHSFQYELGVYDCTTDVRVESGRTYVYRLAPGCVIELEQGAQANPGAKEAAVRPADRR